MTELAVARLGPARRKDFLRLHHEANGLGWCRCVAWWLPTWEGFGERSAEENLALRDALFARGERDGYLAYEAGQVVGWCQVGRRDAFPLLLHEVGEEAGETEGEPVPWVISCFAVAPAARRRRVASRLLEEVLRDLRRRGIFRVEAVPRRGDAHGEAELWNGPLVMFERLGFEFVQNVGSRALYRLDLRSQADGAGP